MSVFNFSVAFSNFSINILVVQNGCCKMNTALFDYSWLTIIDISNEIKVCNKVELQHTIFVHYNKKNLLNFTLKKKSRNILIIEYQSC